jgi:hypothetical protein
VLIPAATSDFFQQLAPVPDEFGGTGALPLVPDPRDFVPEMHPRLLEKLVTGPPPSFDRSQGSCEILSQGATGACVICSTQGGIQIDNQIERGICYHFDWQTFYKELGGAGSNGVDSRATLQRCVDVGAPTRDGARIKIGSYFRCDNLPGPFEAQIKAAVSGGMVAVIATLLPTTFGGTWRPGTPTTGYHQLEVAGYRDRLFWGPNSWGREWGGGNGHPPGFYELSFDYVTSQNFLNGYVYAFVFDPFEFHGPQPNPNPEPHPLPQPQPNPDALGVMLARLNRERSTFGSPLLARLGPLETAAQRFAQRMATENFYRHIDPQGGTPEQRLAAVGITGTWGENIAAGISDPDAVVDAWMASPGHQSNLLSPAFTHVGLGLGTNPNSQWQTYWVNDFWAKSSGPGPNPDPNPNPTPAKVTVRGTVDGTGTAGLSVGQTLSAQGSGFVGTIALTEVTRDPQPDPHPNPNPHPEPEPQPGALTLKFAGRGQVLAAWATDAAGSFVAAELTATVDGVVLGTVRSQNNTPARFLGPRGGRAWRVSAVADDSRAGEGDWP